MRTLFVGAGAIGSLVGAYLAKGGAEVTLLDIADHIHTIAKEGLKVRAIGGDSFEVKVKAVSDAKTIDNIDLLILTVKTFHTESALASVAHLKNRIQVALSIQNGVEKEDHLIRLFGKEKVAGAMCLEGATRLGPTEILHTMSGITYIGELDGRETDRVKAVCQLFTAGGLKAEVTPHILAADWAKWINFAAASAVCSLTRLEYFKILKNRELALLFAQIYREYAQLAKAKGIEVRDYPGFEVKTISEADLSGAIKFLQARGEGLEAKGMTKVKPSLCQDVEGGRKTEYEAIFGYAVQEAEKKGIEMPLTRHVYQFLKGIDGMLGVP
ncbi:MAG: 2-dehydropantoate 2-reductase [Deltaproteobacteria bacterium]|jgi:2-dehydropantoate 2-reductase|nr:2-dehydropantoate 2-reductase [Deltaproteobacteria bacterium]